MSMTRRNMLQQAATALGVGMVAANPGTAALAAGGRESAGRRSGEIKPVWTKPALAPGEAGRDYRPVVTPNGITLPYKVVNGAKVFHLVAEEVEHHLTKQLKAKCWGFNGHVHGPTIEAVEGDRVRIYVTNKLPAATSVHWHGIILPNGMDGVAGVTQKQINPGDTFKYEFTIHQHGTFMYHSHHDEMTQMALGLMGMIVVHPREKTPAPDRDYVIMLSEWRINPGTSRPITTEMTDFNMFTMNGVSFPATEPLLAKVGDRVRIRIGNLSAMDHHPIHLHGHAFKIVATDGGDIPEGAQWPETAVLVHVGSTRTIEFIADNPGDWPMHCHMTHHMMNQMGHNLPNMIGVDAGGLDKKINALLPQYMTMGQTGMAEMAEMSMGGPDNMAEMSWNGPFGGTLFGGMTTVLKVRNELDDTSAASWYEHPPWQVATVATKDELDSDDIKIEAKAASHKNQEHTH